MIFSETASWSPSDLLGTWLLRSVYHSKSKWIRLWHCPQLWHGPQEPVLVEMRLSPPAGRTAGLQVTLPQCHQCICIPYRRLVSGYKGVWTNHCWSCPKPTTKVRILGDLLKDNITQWTRTHQKKAVNGISEKDPHPALHFGKVCLPQAKCALWGTSRS